MASTISSRPSHYEALGLSPGATQDDIAKAFAKAMGLFGARSAAAAAQIGLAFETLRNPEKRRAYDEALGLRRAPPPPAPMAVSFRISAPSPAEPHVEPARAPAAESVIATSLREIARPVELSPSTRPAVRPQPSPAKRAIAPAAAADEADEDAAAPFDWKRPALAVGTVVLAAGLIGALAGVWVRGDVQGDAAVTIPLPSAKARPHGTSQAAAVEAPVAAPEMSSAPEPQSRAQRSAHRERVPKPQSASASAEVAQTAPDPVDTAAVQPASEQAAADPLAPEPQSSLESVAAAGLPLAGQTVARTIERIGYDCGAVASTSAVEGAAGVYKVTCTSGQSYRAAPVHGRYRFRRWSSH